MAGSNTVNRLREVVESTLTAADQKRKLLELLGNVAHEVLGARVLVATYAGEKYHPGTTLLRTDRDLQEQEWQGSIGLVIAMGPEAYKWDCEDGRFPYEGVKPEVGDWVMVRPADGLKMNIKQWPCRSFADENIQMIVRDPAIYW